MDSSTQRSHKKLIKHVRVMQVSIITNETGHLAEINFIKSSKSQAVDNFVRESIRSSWPQESSPNTNTVVQLTYSNTEGFSEPQTLSISPASAPTSIPQS